MKNVTSRVDTLWRIASKCCEDWKFSPPNPVHWQQRRHEKEKNWETFTCSAVTKLFWHRGPAEILFCNIYRYGQLQHFSLFQTAVGFFSKRQQKHFCSNPHSAVNWNSYKCCPATSCCCQSHMMIVVIEHENAFVKHRCFFFLFSFFFFNEKTETNMERLKRPWGCIWGIWGLVRRGVKQMDLCIFTSSGTQTHEMMGVRGLEPCKRLHDCVPACLPACTLLHHHSRVDGAWSHLFSA